MPLLWLILYGSLILVTNGQNQNAIGAHRAFHKTSFSCTGRPAGYYADIETGCQIYHMCDGLGRQFSYSCPNTTLFQQRMLICDHWYMVNCSKAESDYAANLLIGQRDKPFVNDEENNLRTPRPDLLDRPYAPDYSGESFRNQYKQFPAVQNQIEDNVQKYANKLNANNQLSNGQTHWKIPPPSRLILPPAYEPQIENAFHQNVVQQSTLGTVLKRNNTSITTHRTEKATEKNNFNDFGITVLHKPKSDTFLADNDDLGTSHSTRYNTSADFDSAEVKSIKSSKSVINQKFSLPTIKTQPTIKVPSKIYEPPFVYPIYNLDEQNTTTEQISLRVSTAAPFTPPAIPPAITRATTTITTTRSPSRPTTLAGQPFTANNLPATTADSATSGGRNQNNLLQNQHFDIQKSTKHGPTPIPAQGFKSAITTKTPTTLSSAKTATTNLPALPYNDLLPPYTNLIEHDVATTQGPPIYFEWKIPSNGLEPPKLEPPIGVDGREYPDAVIDYNSNSTSIENKSINLNNVQNPFLRSVIEHTKLINTNNQNQNNQISESNQSNQTERIPTSRSIKETGQPNNVDGKLTAQDKATAQRRSDISIAADIIELRKELSVPEYAFPLETIGRTGYLASDTYNSFQLKIPERKGDADEKLHWFGENPKCPECHPSYVVPGTCEPCVRR